MKILAIAGSPRLGGNSSYLLERALEEAEKMGVETEKLVLSKYQVNPCQGHDKCSSFPTCRQNDDAGWILDKLCDADGVILATPVYWYDVSAQMKAFIDRNYFLYLHNRKWKADAVGLIVVAHSAGTERALDTLNLLINNMSHVGKDNRLVMSAHAARVGDAQKNSALVEEARKLGRRMAEELIGKK